MPVTNLEDDTWCSPSDAPITSVVPGSVSDKFCIEWDGTYYSLPFVPPKATATQECNDPAPTWAYQIDQGNFNSQIIKVQIDATTKTIWLKPMLAGVGSSITTNITVFARLPSGETTTFTFRVEMVDLNCAVDVIPSAPLDQLYTIMSILAGYEAPEFTYPDPSCPHPIEYTNTISTNNFITGISDNAGVGRLVEWQSNDLQDIGQYTVTITGSV